MNQGLLTLMLALLTMPSHAFTAPFFENRNLKQQVEQNESALLPCTEVYCLALQGWLFYRWPALITRGSYELIPDADPESFSYIYNPGRAIYYHGGYWFDAFAELNPNAEFTINVQLAMSLGASSYGTASQAHVIPFPSIEWHHQFDSEFRASLRGYDIGKQTLATGLYLEGKQISGMRTEFASQDFKLLQILDGTGGFQVQGDLWYWQFDYQEKFGIYMISETGLLDPGFGAFVRFIVNDSSRFSIEGTSIKRYEAFLVRYDAEAEGAGWDLKFGAQLRYYELGLTKIFTDPGEVMEYLPASYEDRDFINPENLFRRYGDDFAVASLRLRARKVVDQHHYASFDLEPVLEKVGKAKIRGQVFGKLAAGYCPISVGRECGEIFVSNKAFLGSEAGAAHQSISDSNWGGKILFYPHWFLGMNVHFTY